MFTTFLSSENKANDQKKLKKMVEELANKYGKTEDEIFYAYDQWVFFLLKQKSFFYFFLWNRILIQTCKSISSGSWRNIPQEWSRRSSSLTRWGLSIRTQKNFVDNVEKHDGNDCCHTGGHLVWLCVRDVRRGQQWEHGLSREHDCNHNNYIVTMLMIWGKKSSGRSKVYLGEVCDDDEHSWGEAELDLWDLRLGWRWEEKSLESF